MPIRFEIVVLKHDFNADLTTNVLGPSLNMSATEGSIAAWIRVRDGVTVSGSEVLRIVHRVGTLARGPEPGGVGSGL